MNVYAMYGVGGLLSISLLFFGMYSMSNVVGKVVYEKPATQTASVIVTNVPSLDEEEDAVLVPEKEEVVEEEIVQESEPEVELVPAVEEAPIPEPTPPPVEETNTEADTVAALQEQVNSLLEQVEQVEQASAGSESSDSSQYFITPAGVKIDANGNVVNDDGEVEAETTTETSQPEPVLADLPSGYYRLPNGTVIGPGGVIVNEDDITQATEQEEQANVTSLDYFITPTGQKIDRYGNIIE